MTNAFALCVVSNSVQVLASVAVTDLELEEDKEEHSGSRAGKMFLTVSSKLQKGSKVKENAFFGVQRVTNVQEEPAPPLPESAVSVDMRMQLSLSPSFCLIAGADKWIVVCANRTKRAALWEDIQAHKYKHRVFGQSIALLASRDGKVEVFFLVLSFLSNRHFRLSPTSSLHAERSCARTCSSRVGLFVLCCVCLTATLGLFRLSGQQSVLDAVIKQVNMGNKVEVEQLAPHDVSGIFKVWIRMLPSPVIPGGLLNDFLDTNKIDDVEERKKALRELIYGKIPTEHEKVLNFILFVLAEVAKHSAQNMMSADNLALIFGPALFFALSQDVTPEELMEQAK